MEKYVSFLWALCLHTLLAGKNFSMAADNIEITTNSGVAGTCSVYPGYDISPGFDLSMTYEGSQANCCKRCFEQPDCKGWTMYENKCHLKASTTLEKSRAEVAEDTVSGLVDAGGVKATPIFSDKPPQVHSPNDSDGIQSTCSVHTDFQIEGNDLKNLGYMFLSKCCHECGNTPECTGWTYHDWQCILKSGTQLSPSTGDISGLILTNPEVPPTPIGGDVAPPSE